MNRLTEAVDRVLGHTIPKAIDQALRQPDSAAWLSQQPLSPKQRDEALGAIKAAGWVKTRPVVTPPAGVMEKGKAGFLDEAGKLKLSDGY